jgi:adhesin transport system membrane fusion protein
MSRYDDSLSHHQDSDLAYMRSLSAAIVQRSPHYLVMTVAITAVILLSAVLWMAWAEIDVVVRGNGKVIPSRQVQLIQSLEGGVVSEILVREGEMVEANQPLLKVSDVAFSGSFEENRLLYYELSAKSARLKAEAYDTDFEYDKELQKVAPELLASEESLFKTNHQQLKETLSIYGEQVSQQQSVLEESKSKKRQLEKSLDLLRQEINIKEPLMQRRIISEVEFIQLKQREAEIEGEINVVGISLSRIRSMVEEGRRKLEQSRLGLRSKAKRELNEVLAEITRISEAQNVLKDRVSRTVLRSPVKGVVKKLNANTIGGVVAPGSNVLEIVPTGDDLLIEVKIKPADIANINVDQLTRLKFTAYDFAIHGSIKGRVSFISADTITDEDGESYYIVRIIPSQTYLSYRLRLLPIKVGMTSEVDIITSKKTILEYLLKPITRGLGKALRES